MVNFKDVYFEQLGRSRLAFVGECNKAAQFYVFDERANQIVKMGRTRTRGKVTKSIVRQRIILLDIFLYDRGGYYQ